MRLARFASPDIALKLVRVACMAALGTALTGCANLRLPDWLGGAAEANTPTASSTRVQEAPAPAVDRRELLIAVTSNHRLITFEARAPETLLSRVPLMGLLPGESVLGIDHRVAKGQLFALSTRGRLLRIDTATGDVQAVGPAVKLPVARTFGVDFNPAVDRIRVVSDAGHNLRLHPDTGAQVDGDPALEGVQPDGPLAYVGDDPQAGQPPRLVAAGYTYNPDNEKLTTNYAIDARGRHLVMQGSAEGEQPVVSPNTGRLRTVGALQVQGFDHAAFDIADTNNRAYLLTGRIGSTASRLYEVDLRSGRAGFIGLVGLPRERETLGALLGLSVVP